MHKGLSRRSFMLASGAASAALATRGFAAPMQDHKSLDAIARSRGLQFGAATSGAELAQPDLARLLAEECSVLVGENAFKWKHLEPRQGRTQFDEAEAICAFANRNEIELRGHCFVWSQDNRIPDWQLAREEEYAERGGEKLIGEMWRHAEALATRFPQIKSWDAVNEVILPGRGEIRSSLLSRVFGEQLMDVAFGIMRAKMPDTQLVYNDYMCWERNPRHRDGVLRLLENALKRNVPIDALGIQSHLANTLASPIDELGWHKFLEEVEGMGLKILITELDCGDRNLEASEPEKRDLEVAAFVKGYLDLTLSFTSVERVVLWSMSDRDSYLNRPQYPAERRRPDGLPMRGHPWDESLAPKPMRDAIAAAMLGAPARTHEGR